MPESSHHSEGTVPAEAMALASARYGMAIERLANALARCATTAPGGTRWPRYQLPREHRIYALIAFEDESVIAGGEDSAQARARLAEKLMHLAAAVPDDDETEGEHDAA